MTKAEYKRLLGAARGKNIRLYYLMMTLCSTGIRISVLHYITVQAVRAGRADIRMKGKCRTILMPKNCVPIYYGIADNRRFMRE